MGGGSLAEGYSACAISQAAPQLPQATALLETSAHVRLLNDRPLRKKNTASGGQLRMSNRSQTVRAGMGGSHRVWELVRRRTRTWLSSLNTNCLEERTRPSAHARSRETARLPSSAPARP